MPPRGTFESGSDSRLGDEDDFAGFSHPYPAGNRLDTLSVSLLFLGLILSKLIQAHQSNRCLLVSYGEKEINSSSHVLAFAEALALQGWDAHVAFLANQKLPARFEFHHFVNGQLTAIESLLPYSIVHVWTPRRAIWDFLALHKTLIAGALLLHLEDDEDEVLRSLSDGRLIPTLALKDEEMKRNRLSRWTHPFWGRCLAANADGVTALSPSLRHYLPAGSDCRIILPPVRESDFTRPADSNKIVRGQILFAGTVNRAVRDDFLALAEAVGRLRGIGISVTLLRCGANGDGAGAVLSAAKRLAGEFQDLGFVSESECLSLIRTSDVLVQPGAPTRFNRCRFPAKLVPYLASGRPALVPRVYEWVGLSEGENCEFLHSSDAAEIESKLRHLLSDPAKRDAMGVKAWGLSRTLFSVETQGQVLSRYYQDVLSRPRTIPWARGAGLDALLAWRTATAPGANANELLQNAAFRAYTLDPLQHSLAFLPAHFNPLVSVVVPCYNHREFLERRLQSICAQSHRHIEVVLLDDASTDGSLELLKQAKLPFPTTLVASETNSGSPFKQWARGLALCRAEFVWIAESDDDASPDFVRRLLAMLLVAPQVAIAFCRSRLVTSKDKNLGFCRDYLGDEPGVWKRTRVLTTSESQERMLVENFIPNASACLFRKDELARVLPFAESYKVCGDWMIYGRISQRNAIAYVSDALNIYRQHDGSVRTTTDRSGQYLLERYIVQTALHARESAKFTNLEIARQRSAEAVLHSLRKGINSREGWWNALLTTARSFDPFFEARLLHLLRERNELEGSYVRASLIESTASLLDLSPHPAGSFVLMVVVGHLASGGAEQYLLEVLRTARSRLGWRVCVVATRNGADEWWWRFEEASDEVIALARHWPHANMGEALGRLIKSRKPCCLGVSHSEVAYHYLSDISAFFPKLVVFDVLHLVALAWRSGGFPALSLLNKTAISAHLVVSHRMKQWLSARGIPKESIHVVHAGVPPVFGEAKLNRSANPLRLLFVGRLVEAKQPRLIVEIVHRLYGIGVEFRLEVVGDGPEGPFVRDALFSIIPESVVWHGELPQSRIAKILHGADFLILPSKEEGLALVLIEAMQQGVIPLATNVGGQEELVTSDCGYLFPVCEHLPKLMAETIRALASDGNRRREMSEACRMRVKRDFSAPRFTAEIENFLKRMIADRDLTFDSSPGIFSNLSVAQQRSLIGAAAFSAPTDEWQKAKDRGSSIIHLVSSAAAVARKSPVGGLTRWIENRFGDQLGRLVVRLSRWRTRTSQ